MKKITFDKPKSVWPARAAFGAAVAGMAVAAWWFTKSDYEPVRLLTPEEQAALRHDPARNPPPKNWEDSFIREKVPGEGAGNEWVQAAVEPEHDPIDRWAPHDEIEKGICDLDSLERYRAAQAAWAKYQARPATAQERYELLDKVYNAPHKDKVTGLGHDEIRAMLVDATKMAFAEAQAQPVPTDPAAAFNHYARMTSYINTQRHLKGEVVGVSEGDDYLPDELHAIQVIVETQMNSFMSEKNERTRRDFIAQYRQGIKPGLEGIKLYDENSGGTSIYGLFYREMLEESSWGYDKFVAYNNAIGISLDEAKGIALFIAKVTAYQEERRKAVIADAESFRNSRPADMCQPSIR